jgi:glycosyltransferase involved in cell wall biosynthesis
MPRWRQRLEGGMERAVVSRADRVICNTPAMQRAFLKTYPDADPSKFVTITNGYDEADLAPITPEPASRFQILYPGVIDNENRNPRGLLQGVRRALDNSWLSERDLLISFLGAGPYGASEPFGRDVKESRLEGSVDVTVDRIPYGKALARMAGADVVVVLSDSLADATGDGVQSWTAMQVPAKLYEYLRLGRPLLALVSDGAVAELLETTGASVPVSPQDVAEVALALKQLYESRRPVPTRVPPANAAISSYSREQLTVALAAQLDALVRRTTIAR